MVRLHPRFRVIGGNKRQCKKKFNIKLNWELIKLVVSKKFNKILILRGGISDELEISRLSENHVYKTIKNLGDVSCIDVLMIVKN